MFTEALNIVLICKSDVKSLKLVVSVINQLREENVCSSAMPFV